MDRWPRSRCVISMAEEGRNVPFPAKICEELAAMAGVDILEQAKAN